MQRDDDHQQISADQTSTTTVNTLLIQLRYCSADERVAARLELQRQAVAMSHLSSICSLAADVVTLRYTRCQQCCQKWSQDQAATVAASSSDCFAASAAGGAAVRCVILVARPFAVWIVAPDAIPTASGPSTKLKLKRLHHESQKGMRMILVANHRGAEDRGPCTVTQTLT